ncbi:hypothetical protein BJY04DRAFT_138231 [Aspergillus karnatakaensis]|uniref:uncharacterized protein n=1 Tax=Aspergillus karnatakaensis TaxID=1810916 RepID=UPI003CCD2BD4
MADIAYRSLFLFFGYLTLITSSSLLCCRTIYTRYGARQKNNDWAIPERRRQFWLFVLLAALSLGSTWYYMINLFFYSYRTWATSIVGLPYSGVETPLLTRMGLWLKNTKIFQEAWETVSENPFRVWWSGQIFGWTIGWSLLLGITGRRYHIPHVWVYMFVAQAVSVSFAANLFFAAITVSPRPNEREIRFSWYPPLLYELLPVALSILDSLAVPIYAYQKRFMLVLLAPHFLVFIPCVLGPRSSSVKPIKAQGDYTTQRYAVFMLWVAAASVVLQAYFTILVLRELGTDMPYTEVAQRLLDTVYVHPACSSVSWDVIMCTISGFAWALVHGLNASKMLGGRELVKR